jgi:hypothetical protein
VTEEQIQRVQAAHTELAKALGELRNSTQYPKVVRALSTSITHAETSFLWFKSAVTDYDHDGEPL